MVEKYGRNVDRDWPSLPSTESGIQAPPAAIAPTSSSAEMNPASSGDNPATATPVTTGNTPIPDPITIRTADIGNNADNTSTSTGTNPTTIETNVNPATSTVSTNTETSSQINEESISFATVTPDLCASNANTPQPTVRSDNTAPPRRPSISNRLQRLEHIFFGSQKQSGQQEGILKRLGNLEEQVFGDQYEKALKGVLRRLVRLEEISTRLQKLEDFFFGSHNARGGISKRLENLEYEVFGNQCDEKESNGVIYRLEGLEELAS